MRHLVACLLGCERGHRLPSDHRQGGPSATGDVRLARSYVSMTTAVGRSESVRAKGRWYQVSSERIPKQSSTITLALDIDDLRRRGVSDPFHILVGCRSLTDRRSDSSRRRLTDRGATDGPEREPCAPPPLVRCHKRTDASFDLGLAAALHAWVVGRNRTAWKPRSIQLAALLRWGGSEVRPRLYGARICTGGCARLHAAAGHPAARLGALLQAGSDGHLHSRHRERQREYRVLLWPHRLPVGAQRAGRLESFLCSVRRCIFKLRAVAETLPLFSPRTR